MSASAPPFSPVGRGRLPIPPFIKWPLVGAGILGLSCAATWYFVIPHRQAAPKVQSAHWEVGRDLKNLKVADDAVPPKDAPPPAEHAQKFDTQPPPAKAPVHLMQVWGVSGSNTPPPTTNARGVGSGPRSPTGYANANGTGVAPPQEEGGQGAGSSNTEYGQALQGTKQHTTEAGVYSDYSLLLKAGKDIECITNSPLDNQLAGPIDCTVQHDVYGGDGNNILIDRLAMAHGEVTRGIGPGQDRAFVLWQSIDSGHVYAELGSPGADQLGQNGVPGIVDNHWPEKLSAVVALTAIETTGNVLQNLASKQGSSSINFSQGQSLASSAAQQSLNIPKTLWLGQGRTLMIHIQHNVQFHRAYGNRLVAGVE